MQGLQLINNELEMHLLELTEKYKLLEGEYQQIKRDCEQYQNTADDHAKELNQKNHLLIQQIEELEKVKNEYESALKKASELETSLFDKISH